MHRTVSEVNKIPFSKKPNSLTTVRYQKRNTINWTHSYKESHNEKVTFGWVLSGWEACEKNGTLIPYPTANVDNARQKRTQSGIPYCKISRRNLLVFLIRLIRRPAFGEVLLVFINLRIGLVKRSVLALPEFSGLRPWPRRWTKSKSRRTNRQSRQL